jgi:hypothetical protein
VCASLVGRLSRSSSRIHGSSSRGRFSQPSNHVPDEYGSIHDRDSD